MEVILTTRWHGLKNRLNKLGAVARFFGEASDFYKALDALSKELSSARTTMLFIGAARHNERMGHILNATSGTKQLMREIGQYVTLQGLDDTKADVRSGVMRWFSNLDESYSDFFDQAEKQANRLLLIYTYLYQGGNEAEADQYAQLARDPGLQKCVTISYKKGVFSSMASGALQGWMPGDTLIATA